MIRQTWRLAAETCAEIVWRMPALEPAFVVPDQQVVELVKEELPEKLTVMAVGGAGGD